MSEKRRLVTNTLANGVAQFAGVVSAIVFMPMLVRTFGLQDFGLYILAGSIGAYASLLDLGVGASLAKMVAEAQAQADQHKIRQLASTALAFYMGIGLIATAAIALIAFNAGVVFHVNADGARLLRNLLLVAAVSSLWAWPANTAAGVLAGLQRYTLTARTSLFVLVGGMVVTAGVVITRQGPLVLMLGNAVVGLIGMGINAYLAWQEIGRSRISPLDARRDVAKSIFGFSWAVFVIQVATVIIYQATDRIVLGVFLGAAAIGLYEAAGKFLGFVTQGITFTNSAVLPMASNLNAAKRHDVLENLIYRGSKLATALVLPCVLVLMILSRPLIAGWLGPTFAGQAANAAILVSPWLIIITLTMADNAIIAKGLLPKRIPYVIGFALANLVISVALVRPLGIRGVVLGTAIPYLLDFPLHLMFIKKHLQLQWKDMATRVFLPTYPLLVIPAAVAGLALLTPLTSRLLGTALVAVVAVGAYWLVFLLLNPAERADAFKAWTALSARFGRSAAAAS